MSGLPPKPDFGSRDDDRRSPPRRPERSDHNRRASPSRGPPPLADSYIAPAGDTYVPRHDERSRRPSPPRSWGEPSRRSPPPRRDDWRQRDELMDRRRDYPPRSRDYSRGGPRDRDWRRDRDYDDRARRYSRRSPSPHDRDRRWTSRGSPSPPRRSTYDYRRRSPPYNSRRSASPPRNRRPSPGRREDGRFSPRRPPPRDDDRETRPTYRRSHSRSRTRSRTPRQSAPQVEVTTTESTSEVSAPAERVAVRPQPPSPHHQEPSHQLGGPSEDNVPKPSIPTETAPESAADLDVTMVDVQPPTQPKAFSVSTTAPPTQPKNFSRPPPTRPRLDPTISGQVHPSYQPQTPGTASAPVPTQDPDPAVAETTVEEEPEIKLPEIKRFELPNASGKEKDKSHAKNIDNTINKLLRKSYVMRAEYGETLKATRKAIHEQEMAEIELAAARMRREVADSQLEKARLGLLGIDFDGISGLVTNE